ncbi:MAG: YlbF family regulator, partial [Blautia hansenii]
MSFVETCTEMLVSAIRNGSTYKEYCAALDAVFKIPGLKEQVDEIRRLNYRVQNASEETKLYEEMDDLDEKMDALSGIPEVNRFL